MCFTCMFIIWMWCLFESTSSFLIVKLHMYFMSENKLPTTTVSENFLLFYWSFYLWKIMHMCWWLRWVECHVFHRHRLIIQYANNVLASSFISFYSQDGEIDLRCGFTNLNLLIIGWRGMNRNMREYITNG